MKHTCVVGGGITGIAAVWELERRPDAETLDVAWLEAGEHPGGKIRTVEQDGFRFEQGPDSFISQKPWLKAWCEDLGIADQLARDMGGKFLVHVGSGLVDIVAPDDQPLVPGPDHAHQTHTDTTDIGAGLHYPVKN